MKAVFPPFSLYYCCCYVVLLLSWGNRSSYYVSCQTTTTLPTLNNNLCDYDTIYNAIKSDQVVEYNMQVRYRSCPNNEPNQPCGTIVSNVTMPGPSLNGVRTENVITINNEYPGQVIRAKLGDTIRVTVENFLGESTAIHFHGITQFRTPYEDGDQMVTNCPIPDGESRIYEFIAHPAGTTFYHSHFRSQQAAGLQGVLIVEDPADEITDDIPLLISDWYHQDADYNFEFWAQNTPGACVSFGGYRYTGNINPANDGVTVVGAVVADALFFQGFVVNGKGSYQYNGTQVPGLFNNRTYQEQLCPGQTDTPPQCQFCMNTSDFSKSFACDVSSAEAECGELSVSEVKQHKKSKLRLVNSGALYTYQLCIDGHRLTIVAADSSPVDEVDCILVTTGERYDVVIEAHVAGDYWIRMTTVEEQIVQDFGTTSNSVGLPHQSTAILRVVGNSSSSNTSATELSQDRTPLVCDEDMNMTTNCITSSNSSSTAYWLNSSTMGCSAASVTQDPTRCKSVFELVAATTGDQDYTICTGKNLTLGYDVEPNVKVTVTMSFLPDEVPRYQGMSLNSRIEILDENEWGFPYFTPSDKDIWASQTHAPISFIDSGSPVLSLDNATRSAIYARRDIFREVDYSNTGELPPNYPTMFSQGTIGTQALQVNYGDVVRIVFTCAQPYGPGCAMPHPMHLHGNKMAVLYQGLWNDTYNESNFNLENPVYRDTVVVPTDGYVVVQFVANNPGVWRFHCHVNIHHRSGMAFLVDVGGDEAVEAIRATPASRNGCPVQANYFSDISGPVNSPVSSPSSGIPLSPVASVPNPVPTSSSSSLINNAMMKLITFIVAGSTMSLIFSNL